MNLGYVLLAGAIAAEVTATSLLPRTHGFTTPGPTVVVLIGYGVSFYLLSHVVRTIPVGIAYAIWSGVGTLVVLAVSVAFLGQRVTSPQVGGVLLVVIGVALLNSTG